MTSSNNAASGTGEVSLPQGFETEALPAPEPRSDSADAFMWALMQTGDLKTLVAMLPRPKR